VEKSVLTSLVRKHETPWQLESYGSLRTRWLKDKICCVNSVNNTSLIMKYFLISPQVWSLGDGCVRLSSRYLKNTKLMLIFLFEDFMLRVKDLKKEKHFC